MGLVAENDPQITADAPGPSAAQLRAELDALGGSAPPEADRLQLEGLLQARLAVLEGIDRGALLDLAAWSGLSPAQASAANVDLVRQILRSSPGRIEELSLRGLRALGRIREIPGAEEMSREELERRLRPEEGFWAQVRRRRRQLVGSLLERALAGTEGPEPGPKPHPPTEESLRKRIERQGVVTGIAQSLRGAADEYIAQKLDEIEQRIDAKLAEIEARLEEWRDREIATRLRLLKITLLFAIVVALISVGYDAVRLRMAAPPPPAASAPPPAAEPEQP
jgi:hypothetical protein